MTGRIADRRTRFESVGGGLNGVPASLLVRQQVVERGKLMSWSHSRMPTIFEVVAPVVGRDS